MSNVALFNKRDNIKNMYYQFAEIEPRAGLSNDKSAGGDFQRELSQKTAW